MSLTRPTLRLRMAMLFGGTALLGAGALAVSLWLAPPVVAAIVVFSIAAAAGFAGYLVVGRAMRPLLEVTATARRLSTKNLTERIGNAGPGPELTELADTFNAMLDRISDSFESQRRFVANASHELRTPLTVMRTEIDVALSNPEDDVVELRHMGSVVRDGCNRANDLIESLLWLARAEAEGARLASPLPTDLAECAAEAVETAELLADELGLSLGHSLAPAPVMGDPALLQRVAGNLIENAIRHNVPDGRIWVLSGCENGISWLVVGNTGSQVDAESVPRLFEPFNRGDTARVGRRGAGLGLSIVRAACDAHQGMIRADALPQDGGLEVRVEIPALGLDPDPADQ
ncbi:signal transduction histidine kinase [Stackebrandtia endophytica]|uniref:histidine kinase n=1 Tax=Stackebrandtia endophytica TaxID=1496996 RepID=A0A543B374_9ACTN|nr:HAMP domain-containing sensor histidine kinase [Stackebrandtia endophytica]TQL79220.1 signal transduction histidine kinase [Stackebrandtia endophytica]